MLYTIHNAKHKLLRPRYKITIILDMTNQQEGEPCRGIWRFKCASGLTCEHNNTDDRRNPEWDPEILGKCIKIGKSNY